MLQHNEPENVGERGDGPATASHLLTFMPSRAPTSWQQVAPDRAEDEERTSRWCLEASDGRSEERSRPRVGGTRSDWQLGNS